MQISIPYQNTTNKLVFDYINSCAQMLSNVNFATDLESDEAKDTNKIYLLVTESNEVYLFCALSCKDFEHNIYEAIDTIWVKVEGVEIEDRTNMSTMVYLFDLKKFFSTMSFSTNYKDRNTIYISDSAEGNNLVYSISETIKVDIAKKMLGNKYEKIVNQFKVDMLDKINQKVDVMSIVNVDKNSFLLPYFNHKECLNFAVARSTSKSYICQTNGDNYIIVENRENNGSLLYMSRNLLRRDKFDVFNSGNVIDVSTGLWLMLVILQGSKVWSKTDVYANHAETTFKDMTVYSFFHKDARYEFDTINYDWLSDYKYVGKLKAEEVFTLSKLFTDAKNSYFDFSSQKFVGCNYIFDDEVRNEDGDLKKTEIDFTYKCVSELPLKISFAELKHYIGTDLSQKTFILKFYTNGTEVLIEKWNKDETKQESVTIFNHSMSKAYVGS